MQTSQRVTSTAPWFARALEPIGGVPHGGLAIVRQESCNVGMTFSLPRKGFYAFTAVRRRRNPCMPSDMSIVYLDVSKKIGWGGGCNNGTVRSRSRFFRHHPHPLFRFNAIKSWSPVITRSSPFLCYRVVDLRCKNPPSQEAFSGRRGLDPMHG